MIILSKEQILLMHDQLIEETGGSKGLKDEGMLESALAAPYQSFDGKTFFHRFIRRQPDSGMDWQAIMLLSMAIKE